MIHIGVTGHRYIPAETYEHVHEGLTAAVHGRAGPVEAITSLAVGTDQLFAEIALAGGAELTVVIPSLDFERDFPDPADLARYRWLRSKAHKEITLGFTTSCEQAYYEAGVRIVDRSDLVLAVWDGLPARGLGGTADMVAYARRCGKPVTVLWKPGVTRP